MILPIAQLQDSWNPIDIRLVINLFPFPRRCFQKREKEKEKIRERERGGRMLSNVLNIRRSATFSYFFYKFRGRFTDSLSQLSFPGELPSGSLELFTRLISSRCSIDKTFSTVPLFPGKLSLISRIVLSRYNVIILYEPRLA